MTNSHSTDGQALTRANDALHVATHPEIFFDRPSLRIAAWAHLMAARGRRVNQLRLTLDQRAAARP